MHRSVILSAVPLATAACALAASQQPLFSRTDPLLAAIPASLARDVDTPAAADGLGTAAPDPVSTLIPTITSPYHSAYSVDFNFRDVFNPSVVVIPDHMTRDGVRRTLAVGRIHDSDRWVDGRRYGSGAIVACFLERVWVGKTLHQPRAALRCVGGAPPKLLYLPSPEPPIKERIRTGVKLLFDGYLGPEDPRLVWGDGGVLLLIYGQISGYAHLSRTVYVVDARVIFPQLATLMRVDPTSLLPNPPIEFADQTELTISWREDHVVEKNWALFYRYGRMHAQVSISPRIIVEHLDGGSMSRNLIPVGSTTGHCLDQYFDSPVDGDQYEQHQATNVLKIVLCRRGECTPTAQNMVYLSLFHRRRYNPNHCEAFATTWKVTPPFDFVSVSKRIEYLGIPHEAFTYTTSLAFRNMKDVSEGGGRDNAIGWLDDEVLVSVGTEDNSAHLVVTLIEELLREHVKCSDIMNKHE